ncbi:MAG: cytochrome C oxidase subunit IV family protein [Candidatus Hodarchaeales archaeon]
MEVNKSNSEEVVETNKKPYTLVLLLLTLFTIIEISLSFLGETNTDSFIGSMIIVGLVVMALAKALLVAAFFMGIKYHSRPWLLTVGVFGIPLFVAIPIVALPIIGIIISSL